MGKTGMAKRPALSGFDDVSRGFRARQGFSDAKAGLPLFSADRSYVEGYRRGLDEAVSDPRNFSTARDSDEQRTLYRR